MLGAGPLVFTFGGYFHVAHFGHLTDCRGATAAVDSDAATLNGCPAFTRGQSPKRTIRQQ